MQKTKPVSWTKQNTLPVFFSAVPVGTEFAYAASGPVTLKRNVFTKVEPFTASAPNATSAASSKLKLWFQPDAIVRIQRPAAFDDADVERLVHTYGMVNKAALVAELLTQTK